MKFSRLLCLFLGLAGMIRVEANPALAGRQSLVIEQTVPPYFPPDLLAEGFPEGLARIQVVVSAQGELLDWLIVGYTHRRFADEAVKAIRRWKFQPARVNGQPVLAHREISVSFATTGTAVSFNNNDYMESYVNQISNKAARWPCTLKELDRIPTPLQAPAPVYARELAARGVQGVVVVDFFIDETGAVRLPAVAATEVTRKAGMPSAGASGSPDVQADDESRFGELALTAIEQWKFEPPTRKGKPVLLKARQTFRFGPGKS